jgi:hypothetical protein
VTSVPSTRGRSSRVRPANWAVVITAVSAAVAINPNTAQPTQSTASSTQARLLLAHARLRESSAMASRHSATRVSPPIGESSTVRVPLMPSRASPWQGFKRPEALPDSTSQTMLRRDVLACCSGGLPMSDRCPQRPTRSRFIRLRTGKTRAPESIGFIERELRSVKVEVLGRIVVDVEQAHRVLEEGVPTGREVHCPAQGRLCLGVQVPVE